MSTDHSRYYFITNKARLDKAVNSLLGFLEGVSADLNINDIEFGFLANWLEEHMEFANRHPFNELIPVVADALNDNILTEDERSDLIWICDKLRSKNYYDTITADLQRLHAILGGIACDGVINEQELSGLSEWLREHEHLRRCWPYDEVDSLITSIMADKVISKEEHVVLQAFFNEFVSRPIVQQPIREETSILGLCAMCPEITFRNSSFCITGESQKYTRNQFIDMIKKLGGRFMNSVSPSLDYLVIGAEGNPCWAYACYGRKVEKAMELRKKGSKILLIHENDFNDAVADNTDI